jgi:hypothetical protein
VKASYAISVGTKVTTPLFERGFARTRVAHEAGKDIGGRGRRDLRHTVYVGLQGCVALAMFDEDSVMAHRYRFTGRLAMAEARKKIE